MDALQSRQSYTDQNEILLGHGDDMPNTRNFLADTLQFEKDYLEMCSLDDLAAMLSNNFLQGRAPKTVDRSRAPRWSWKAITEAEYHRMTPEQRRARRKKMRKYLCFVSNATKIPLEVIREMDADAFDVAHNIAMDSHLRSSRSAPSSPGGYRPPHQGGAAAAVPGNGPRQVRTGRSAPNSPAGGRRVEFGTPIDRQHPDTSVNQLTDAFGHFRLPGSVGTAPALHNPHVTAHHAPQNGHAPAHHLHPLTHAHHHAHAQQQPQCTCPSKQLNAQKHHGTSPATPAHNDPRATQFQQIVYHDQHGKPVHVLVPTQPQQHHAQHQHAHQTAQHQTHQTQQPQQPQYIQKDGVLYQVVQPGTQVHVQPAAPQTTTTTHVVAGTGTPAVVQQGIPAVVQQGTPGQTTYILDASGNLIPATIPAATTAPASTPAGHQVYQVVGTPSSQPQYQAVAYTSPYTATLPSPAISHATPVSSQQRSGQPSPSAEHAPAPPQYIPHGHQ